MTDSVRLTIMLDKVLETKIRKLQAKRIIETDGSVSFSEMINELLRGAV